MLHKGPEPITKMEQAVEAFCWPMMHQKLRENSESCPSCRAAGKNPKTQRQLAEFNKLETSSDRNQELQLELACAIKYRTRGDVYFLIAIDHFSKWPTAHLCKNTDTRTS